MIINENGKYVVCNKDGKRIGTHNDMPEALNQEMKSNHPANMPTNMPMGMKKSDKREPMNNPSGGNSKKGGMGGMAM